MANQTINFNVNFRTNTRGLELARKSIDDITSKLTNVDIALFNNTNLKQGQQTLQNIYRQVDNLDKAMTAAFNPKLGVVNVERFKEELNKAGTSVDQIKTSMMQAGPVGQQAFAKIAAGLSNVKYETVETTTLLDKMAASLRRNLLTFTSINIINKVRGSVNEAYGYVKNLDKSLKDIRIVTGKTADEMDRFAERANKAAATLGKATTDYTKASTTFYQQGLSDAEVKTRTDITLKAANTTGTDTKQVANNLTALWNGFNVGAEEAEIYVDRLAALAATTATDLDEMTTAMSKNASMAKVMGVSEEQLAAQISTVIAVTRQAPESVGTAFKTIYSRMTDIAAGSEDAEISLGNYSSKLKEMGIEVLDGSGHLKDLGETIEEVGNSWNNYNREQQVAIAGIMGGQRQVNQLMALFDNWDEYSKSINTMADAEGYLQKQQDTYMQSAEGQLQKLRTEWEGVLDSLLSSDDIIKVAKSISPILTSLEKMINAFGGGIGILQKFSPLLMQIASPSIATAFGKAAANASAMKNNLSRDKEVEGLYDILFKDTKITDELSNRIKALLGHFVDLQDQLTADEKNTFLDKIRQFGETEGPKAEAAIRGLVQAKEDLFAADGRTTGTPLTEAFLTDETGKLKTDEESVAKRGEMVQQIKYLANIDFSQADYSLSQVEESLHRVFGEKLPQFVKDALNQAESEESESIKTAMTQTDEMIANGEADIADQQQKLEELQHIRDDLQKQITELEERAKQAQQEFESMEKNTPESRQAENNVRTAAELAAYSGEQLSSLDKQIADAESTLTGSQQQVADQRTIRQGQQANLQDSRVAQQQRALQELAPIFQGMAENAQNAADASHDVEQSTQRIAADAERMEQPLKLKDWEQAGQNMASVAQGAVAAASGLQQLKQLGNIWENNDLTTGEKLAQTLTTIGSIIAITIPSIFGAVKAYQELTKSEVAKTIASKAGAVADLILHRNFSISTVLISVQTIAQKLLTKATWEHVGAVVAEKVAMIAGNPVFLALAAIIGVIVGVYALWTIATKDHTEAMNKELEKIQEQKDKVDNLKNSLDEYYKSQEEHKTKLSQLTKGTDEYNAALDEQEEKVKALIKDHSELRKAVKYDENGRMTLDENIANNVYEEERAEVGKKERKALKKGLYSNFDRSFNKNAQKMTNEEFTNYNKNILMQYTETMSEYDDIDKKTMSALVSRWESMGKDSKKLADQLSKNVEKTKQELLKLQDVVNNFQDLKIKDLNGRTTKISLDYEELISGNTNSVSREEATALLQQTDKELAKILGYDDYDESKLSMPKGGDPETVQIKNEIDSLRDNLTKVYTEDLPAAVTIGWSQIDTSIAKLFKNEAGKIGDKYLEGLGQGFEKLQKEGQDIDSLALDLFAIDYTQGAKTLDELRKKYGELGEEVEAYIKEQIRLHQTVERTQVSFQRLTEAMSKISTLKYGDSLSDKDYEELILKYKELEKYFTKIGDKYIYMAKSNIAVQKELKKAYQEQLDTYKKNKNLIEESIDFSKTWAGDDVGSGVRSESDWHHYIGKQINKNENIKELLLADFSNDVQDMHELETILTTPWEALSKEQQQLYDNMITHLQDIENWSMTSTMAIESQKQQIAAVIDSRKELDEALKNNLISQEAHDAMVDYTTEKELDNIDKIIKKQKELQKTKLQGELESEQNNLSRLQNALQHAEGAEYLALLEEIEQSENRILETKKEQRNLDIETYNQNKVAARQTMLNAMGIETTVDKLGDQDKARLDILIGLVQSGADEESIQKEIGKWVKDQKVDMSLILDTATSLASQEENIKKENEEIEHYYKEQYNTLKKIDDLRTITSGKERTLKRIESQGEGLIGADRVANNKRKNIAREQYRQSKINEQDQLREDIDKTLLTLRGNEENPGGLMKGITIGIERDEYGQVINKDDIIEEATRINNDTKNDIHINIDELEKALDNLTKFSNELEDINDELTNFYKSIDKTADEQAKMTFNNVELSKLEREASSLTGQALADNLKAQAEIKEKNKELYQSIIAEQTEILSAYTSDLNNKLSGTGITAQIENGQLTNEEQIREVLKSLGLLQSDIDDLVDSVKNQAADVQSTKDAAESLDSKVLADFGTIHDANIKALEEENSENEKRMNKLDPTSPEYATLAAKNAANAQKIISEKEENYYDKWVRNENKQAYVHSEDGVYNEEDARKAAGLSEEEWAELAKKGVTYDVNTGMFVGQDGQISTTEDKRIRKYNEERQKADADYFDWYYAKLEAAGSQQNEIQKQINEEKKKQGYIDDEIAKKEKEVNSLTGEDRIKAEDELIALRQKKNDSIQDEIELYKQLEDQQKETAVQFAKNYAKENAEFLTPEAIESLNSLTVDDFEKAYEDGFFNRNVAENIIANSLGKEDWSQLSADEQAYFKKLLDDMESSSDEGRKLEDSLNFFPKKNVFQEYEASMRIVEKRTQSLTESTNKLNAINKQLSITMSQLQDDASFLYGDDLVANLEEQNRCLEQQKGNIKEQVELDKEQREIAEYNLKALQAKQKITLKNLEAAKTHQWEDEDGNNRSISLDDYIDKYGNFDRNKFVTENTDELEEDVETIANRYEQALKENDQTTKDIAAAEQNILNSKNKILEDAAQEEKINNQILKQRQQIAQTKLKTAEESIKRETTASHQFALALKEVDRALNDTQRDQNNLSGPALIAKLQEEIQLQLQKKKILEEQLKQIQLQTKALMDLYAAHMLNEYGVSFDFTVDEAGVANIDELYAALEKVDSKLKASAKSDLDSFVSTLNGMAGNISSTVDSINSMSDSIEDLNKKIKEEQETEAFRVKEEKWYLEEQEIKKLQRELNKLQKEQNHLTGNALLQNLNRQQQVLQKQADAEKRKLSIMKGELSTMQAMLALQGAIFTADGLIANYAELVAQGDEKLNGYLSSYQSFLDSINDLEDQLQDTLDQKAELEYTKAAERLRMFHAKVDVELDLGKAKREWQSFKREFLNTLNGLSALNDSIAEQAKQNLKDLYDLSGRETTLLTGHVNDIISEIYTMQAGGWSDLYGNDQQTALQDLANYRQQLQDTLSSIADKIKAVEEAYMQQLDKIKNKFDDQLSAYEQIQSIIEHDMNLIKLLRGSNTYDELANYYDKSSKNYEKEIAFLRKQVDYWQEKMNSADVGSAEWETFQKNWRDALSKMNSAVDAAVQNLLDKYENLINKTLKAMNKQLTGVDDFGYMKQKWDWANQEADLYLDKIAQEYNIQKLAYKYQDAANKATDPIQRAKILKIMDEELKKLKEKDKLTQYDVERANKIYELKMKQTELEAAANNRTTMRLRRDSEGNYRYEYVADQDKLAELKQEILDMQEEIRQFDLSELRKKKEEAISIIQEFNDQARELILQRLKGDITQEEYDKRIQDLIDHYGVMYDASAIAIDNISSNLKESTLDEMLTLDQITVNELNNMTEAAKDALVNSISPIYHDVVNELTDHIAGEGGFVDVTSTGLAGINDLFEQMQQELQAIESAAGISFDDIIGGIDDTINEMEDLIGQNDNLLNQYEQELQVIEELIDELHDLMDTYRDVYDAAMEAIDVALELREIQQEIENSPANDDIAAMSTGNTGTQGQNKTSNLRRNAVLAIGSSSSQKSDNSGYITTILDDGSLKNFKVKNVTKYNNFDSEKGHRWTTSSGEQYIGQIYDTATSKDEADKKRNKMNNVITSSKFTKGYTLQDKDVRDSIIDRYTEFATGGYTGDWGADGKLAILHEKELVLNKDDTSNILKTVAAIRNNNMDSSYVTNILSGIGEMVQDIYTAIINKTSESVLGAAAALTSSITNQNGNVTNNINATFPNAGNMNEIQNAIMNLPNYASQKLHTNQRMKTTTTAAAFRTNTK